jgi:hypothetical protein
VVPELGVEDGAALVVEIGVGSFRGVGASVDQTVKEISVGEGVV